MQLKKQQKSISLLKQVKKTTKFSSVPFSLSFLTSNQWYRAEAASPPRLFRNRFPYDSFAATAVAAAAAFGTAAAPAADSSAHTAIAAAAGAAAAAEGFSHNN